MNTLDRDITPGEIVVVAKTSRHAQAREGDRRFRCRSGFGMFSATAGSAIFGEWLDGTGDPRADVRQSSLPWPSSRAVLHRANDKLSRCSHRRGVQVA